MYVKSSIILNIINPSGLGIKTDSTAAQMCNSITKRYGVTSALGAVLARSKLDATKLQEGGDVEMHLQLMKSLWTDANNEGAKIDETTFCTILIGSLPIMYAPILGNVLSSHTVAEAEVLIVAWKATIDEINPTQGSTTIPSTMNSSSLLAKANAAKAQLVCLNCKKQGHVKDNCFWAGGGKEGQFPPWWNRRGGGGGNNKDNVNISSANAMKTFAMMAQVDEEPETKMFLDLGTTHYCFRNRSDFETYTDLIAKQGDSATEGGKFSIKGQGRVTRQVEVEGKEINLQFNNA